ncbi:hypothetical protein [Methanosarcina sp. 1.H.A.2.2]|jgi:hypothetical protein|nr:hypothetical protein [Methanosarcina sp. 1.H.A.2.2]
MIIIRKNPFRREKIFIERSLMGTGELKKIGNSGLHDKPETEK